MPRPVGRPAGLPKTGGRKRGTPNKTTAMLKDMIKTALSNLGGVEYLKEQAQKNPAAFLTLLGKVLPLQVTGDDAAPLVLKVVNFAGPATETK
jgi:hypothetical protein